MMTENQLQIRAIDTFMVGSEWCNYLFVQLTTGDGTTGLGEATMQYQSRTVDSAVMHLAKRYVLGANVHDIEKTVALMYREEYARGGPVLNSAIAGIETAMWDAFGKALGQPVHRLLGGRVRVRMPAYANGWFGGATTPADWAGKARDVVAMGYRAMKFDPFWPDGRDPAPERLRAGLEITQAVRDAVGPDIRLLIDGHGRFSPGTAAELAHCLAEIGVHWFEEPVDPENFDALGRVPRVKGVRVAAGERCWSRYQVPMLLANGKPDVLQPDLVQIGGILEAKKIAAIADAHYVPVSFHNPFGPVATAAALQVDATITNAYLQESFCEFGDPVRHAVVSNSPRPTNGDFVLSDLPGLGGIELVPDVIKENPYREDAYISIWDGKPGF